MPQPNPNQLQAQIQSTPAEELDELLRIVAAKKDNPPTLKEIVQTGTSFITDESFGGS